MKFHRIGCNAITKQFFDHVGSQISDTVRDGRRNEQNTELLSFCDAARLRKCGIVGVQLGNKWVAEVQRSQMSI
jgi:hypothetical protein